MNAASDGTTTAEEPDADEYELLGEEPETAGTETEDDIQQANIDYSGVVLAPSDWTVETILSQLTQSAFELDPDFQRRNAWTDQRKSKFIESLALGLPIPQLTLAESEDADGDIRYIVIDGKQRLLALASFFQDKDPLRLKGLGVLLDLNGRTRAELSEEVAGSRLLRRLQNRTVRTVVIRKWPNEAFLHLVFHRINHQTLSLSAQELRQALHPGRFTTFADVYAADSVELHRILGASQQPDFRMRDVELLVRFFGLKRFLPIYQGNLKRFLDETCEKLNKAWSTEEAAIRSDAESCTQAILLTEAVFGDNAFRRYERGRWETRFNRAIYDVMVYYFSDASIAVQLEDTDVQGRVVEAFMSLSRTDSDFNDAVRSTTKTVAATAYRLHAWGESLNAVLDSALKIPRLSTDERRIVLSG